MMHAVVKLLCRISRLIHVVTELVDCVFQGADDLVSLLDVHLLAGFLADPFGRAFQMTIPGHP